MSEEQNYTPEVEYEDGDTFTMQKELSIKDIALNQYNQCCRNMSQEMHAGGVRKVMIQGRVQEIVVQDNISIFFNSVKALGMTLKPYMEKYKDKMKDVYDELDAVQKEIKELEQKQKRFSDLYDANYNNSYREKYEQMFNDVTRRLLNKRIHYYGLKVGEYSTLLSHLNYFAERFSGAV